MKLSDLRPCDNCGGPIGYAFHVFKYSFAAVNPRAVHELSGLSMMLGSPQLAEVMGAHQDDAVQLLADQEDDEGKVEGWHEFFLCTDCFCGDVNVGVMLEKKADAS